jgi:hypothetical protein
MRWRTAHNRAKNPVKICNRVGHATSVGYGLAYGGGPGTYTFCHRCGELIDKVLDAGDDE